jgi:hypothetical protein
MPELEASTVNDSCFAAHAETAALKKKAGILHPGL